MSQITTITFLLIFTFVNNSKEIILCLILIWRLEVTEENANMTQMSRCPFCEKNLIYKIVYIKLFFTLCLFYLNIFYADK